MNESSLVLFSFLLTLSAGHKILGIFPMAAPSHYILSSSILNELAGRGHEITVITPYFQKSPHKNLKEISVDSVIGCVNKRKKKLYGLEQSVFENFNFLIEMGSLVTERILKHENVQKLLLSNETFDLVMAPQFLNEGFMGIAHHFKAPVVTLATMPLFSWSHFLLGHPAPPSYVPNLLSPYRGYMSFGQRLVNSFYDVYFTLYYQWLVLPYHRDLVEKYIPNQPDLYQFVNNVSLVLINSHLSAYEAFPQVPNAKEIGGFHIQEPKTLPEELQQFLDESHDGVVVFSMGSNLKSTDLPDEMLSSILKTFSRLKQNVLWKFEEDSLPGQPKNVKIMKWLPQSDVLAHANIKAFITHGGLLSTMEAIYHGVPCVGIPVFTDQKMNLANAVARGFAVAVPFAELNEETLTKALDQVLHNPRYRNNVRIRSKIMKDRPIKPMDEAIYWIEYVLRHQGAPHLRYPGMELSWYQRNLLDVLGLVVLMFLTVTFVFVKIYQKFVKIVKRYCNNDCCNDQGKKRK